VAVNELTIGTVAVPVDDVTSPVAEPIVTVPVPYDAPVLASVTVQSQVLKALPWVRVSLQFVALRFPSYAVKDVDAALPVGEKLWLLGSVVNVPLVVNALALVEPVAGGVIVSAPTVAEPLLAVTVPLESSVIVPEPSDAPVPSVTVQFQRLDVPDVPVWVKLICAAVPFDTNGTVSDSLNASVPLLSWESRLPDMTTLLVALAGAVALRLMVTFVGVDEVDIVPLEFAIHPWTVMPLVLLTRLPEASKLKSPSRV